MGRIDVDLAHKLVEMLRTQDVEIAEAIRFLFADTHNLAEGAGAAALAALAKDAGRLTGKTAGIVLSGGNLDETMMQTVLAGGTPVV